MGGDVTIETERLALREFLRDDTWLRGQWRSSRLYSILDSEWNPGGTRDPAGSGEAPRAEDRR